METWHRDIPVESAISVDNKILAEQLHLSFGQMKFFTLCTLAATSLLSFTLWENIVLEYFIVWIVMTSVFVVIIPGVVSSQFLKSKPQPEALKYWQRRLVLTSVLISLSWGVSGILLYVHDSIVYQSILLLILVMGILLSSILIIESKTYFYISSICSLLLISVQFVKELDSTYILIGTLIVGVYLILFVKFYSKVHDLLLYSLRLQFQKSKVIEDLTQQKYNAEKESFDKSRFIASSSHDLRDLVHTSSLLIEEFTRKCNSKKMCTIAEDLKITNTTLHNLFESLLDISKIDSGFIKTNFKIFELKKFLRNIISNYHSYANKKGLRIKFKSRSLNISSDPILLTQILHNLITNAIKYTNNGTIYITSRRVANNIRIDVRDSGIGIEQGNIETIFNEYVQLNNPQCDSEYGLGLGLSLVRRIALLLDHPIQVKSNLGNGSVFSITVPIDTNDVITQATYMDDIHLKDTTFNDMHVMLIAEQQLFLTSIEGVLTQWGSFVTTSGSVNDAFSSFENCNKLNFIIIDYSLTKKNRSIDTVSSIQKLVNLKIPILIIADEPEIPELRNLPVQQVKVIHKPVEPAKLRCLMRYLIVKNKSDKCRLKI